MSLDDIYEIYNSAERKWLVDNCDAVRALMSQPATTKDQPVGMSDKLINMTLAHLDGIYKFSARDNCDELVTQLIEENRRLTIQLDAELKWRCDNDNG